MKIHDGRFHYGLFFVALVALATTSPTSPAPETVAENQTNETAVAAIVNGEKITVGQVDRVLSKTVGELSLSPSQQRRARSAVLEKLINQKVVFDFLEQSQAAVGDDEVRLKLEDLQSRLATVEKTIDDYLKQSNQTLDELNFEFAWQSSWLSYLDNKLTDEVLEACFDQHRRQFDGTEVRVAHLLLKPADAKRVSSQEFEELRQLASEIRSNVASKGMRWEAAVAKHSAAATRDAGGEIGWIKIDGPMPKSFTGAAFKLAAGELSSPVETVFGVHLIKCLEVKVGKLGWRDAIEAVKKAASRSYFDSIVEQHRANFTVEYGESFRPKNRYGFLQTDSP